MRSSYRIACGWSWTTSRTMSNLVTRRSKAAPPWQSTATMNRVLKSTMESKHGSEYLDRGNRKSCVFSTRAGGAIRHDHGREGRCLDTRGRQAAQAGAALVH